MIQGVAHIVQLCLRSIQPHGKLLVFIQTGQCAQQLCFACADQPCDPQHLAGVQGKVDRLCLGRKLQAFHLQERLAADRSLVFDLTAQPLLRLHQIFTDHQGNDLPLVGLLLLLGCNKMAVPQNDQRICNFKHLIEQMRNIHDRDTTFLHSPDDRLQPPHFLDAER